MNEIIQTIAVYALPLIFAITLHEAAHGYVAKYFGDMTAYSQGRVSLNPIVHIDPLGTIVIPAVLYMIGSPFLFGYAKPVPVNFGNLRKPKKQMAWVALAGPAANLVMALLWMIFVVILHALRIDAEFFLKMAQAGVSVNLMLFAFNLFPIPPLDGGRIVLSLLPNKLAYKFAQIEPYGFFIVMGLAYLQALHFWMAPMMIIANAFLGLLILPFTFLLG
ncbi:MAG: site-2 protease family protein [Undibacterium sp.]|nr:site-2 protease family protein [Undibacterium sp.]